MNRIFIIIILLSGVLSLTCHSQETLREMKSTIIEKIDGKDYYIHSVKKGQSLYMISKAYNVDINEIIQDNPVVKEGLKAGQKLKILIPQSPRPTRKQANTNAEEKKPTVKSKDEELLPCGMDKSSLKKNYNIALIMPLYLSDVIKMDVNSDADSSTQENRPLQFVEYYEGFRMALDSLEKTGVSLKVTVYDIGHDTLKTIRLLQTPELKNMDLIFGMLYHRNFQLVADFCEKNNIPVVNPLSERELILDKHKKVFKVHPPAKNQFSELIHYLEANFIDSTMIVISDNQRTDKATANTILTALQEKKADVHLSDGDEEVISLLSKRKGNVIILISEDKSFILNVITIFNEHRNEVNATLFGLPRWDRFEDIEADYLVNLKTRLMAPYFIDYDDPGVKKFVAMYQERYQTDPDVLAFQGFDVTFYFITALWRYGKSFERCMPEMHMKSLQTDFHFSSTKGNGFENQDWEMYEYDNYRLKRIPLQ